MAGNLYIGGGTLDLNNHALTVTGNLYQSGGTINYNGGTMNVGGKQYKQEEKLTVNTLQCWSCARYPTYTRVYRFLQYFLSRLLY